MDKICECFKAIIKNRYVHFYSVDTEPKTLLMPFVPTTNYRYNSCPCCGKETRGLELTLNEFRGITE